MGAGEELLPSPQARAPGLLQGPQEATVAGVEAVGEAEEQDEGPLSLTAPPTATNPGRGVQCLL